MPDFYFGGNAKLLYKEFNLGPYFKSFTVNDDVAMLEKNTFDGSLGMKYQPGITNGGISAEGFIDEEEEGSHEVIVASKASVSPQVLTGFQSGYAAQGLPAVLLLVRTANFSEGSGVADLVPLSFSAQSDSGVDYGVVLHALTAETATGNGTAVDNLVLTSNGGVANLHVLAFDGTDATIAIGHAAVATYADLVTFDEITDVTSQQIVVAPGTTINRNLRFQLTGTFDSILFALSFARR